MQWIWDHPFGPPSLLDRVDRVRRGRAARRYAGHGWTVELHGELVLVGTGSMLDAIEVPPGLGAAVRKRDPGGPVAVTAAGRAIFLVRPGSPLRPELERRLDVVRHGPGSWVAVAPSRLPEGLVRWAVAPADTGWHLPAADDVQRMLVEALGPRPVARPAIPRQLSTSRRA